jgi:hypothetical protein
MLKIVNELKGRALFNTFVADFLNLLLIKISDERNMY